MAQIRSGTVAARYESDAMRCGAVRYGCGAVRLRCGTIVVRCGTVRLWCGTVRLWYSRVRLWCGTVRLWYSTVRLWCVTVAVRYRWANFTIRFGHKVNVLLYFNSRRYKFESFSQRKWTRCSRNSARPSSQRKISMKSSNHLILPTKPKSRSWNKW